MKAKELSKKVLEFIFSDENHEYPRLSDSGVLIKIFEVYDWLQVMISVGEDTTHDALREAIPLALEWRNRLLKWQGPRISGGEGEFFLRFNWYKEHGRSHAQLAAMINKNLSNYLKEYNSYIEEYEEVSQNSESSIDIFQWEFKSNPFAFNHAKNLMILVGFSEEEATLILNDEYKSIKEGTPQFFDNYPVTREKVINLLRRWRRGKKYKALKNKEKSENSD